MYKCKLCERTWDTLPEGAVQLTTRKRGGRGHANVYRFSDGITHVIKKQTATNAEEK